MSRRMVSQQDQDYIKVLRTAVDADEEGNVEVGRNLHVDGALLSEGGIISNGTSDLGDLEGITGTNFTGKLFAFGASIFFLSGKFTSTADAVFHVNGELASKYEHSVFLPILSANSTSGSATAYAYVQGNVDNKTLAFTPSAQINNNIIIIG